MLFDWNPEKNDWLQQSRGIRFEDIVTAIQAGGLLDTWRTVIPHATPTSDS